MGKVIECDFRYTERQKELKEIEFALGVIALNFEQDNYQVEEDKNINELVDKYAKLLKENEKYKNCKYRK